MGICLGLSALTLVELTEYLLELLVNGWRNCRNAKERAATRSGIRRVEVLPEDPKTGTQCKLRCRQLSTGRWNVRRWVIIDKVSSQDCRCIGQ